MFSFRSSSPPTASRMPLAYMPLELGRRAARDDAAPSAACLAPRTTSQLEPYLCGCGCGGGP
eukprot:scaffold14470_cov31-Phaeocystis_antarctica.AAC.1